MVTAQNGDRHSNGHVLVENQQTRLEPDSEVHETTSKSKVYRGRFPIGVLLTNIIYKEDFTCTQSHMSYGNTWDGVLTLTHERFF